MAMCCGKSIYYPTIWKWSLRNYLWESTDGENYFKGVLLLSVGAEWRWDQAPCIHKFREAEELLGRDAHEEIKLQQDSARWCVRSGLYFIVLPYPKLNIVQTKAVFNKNVCAICFFCFKTVEMPLFCYLSILLRTDVNSSFNMWTSPQEAQN